MFSVEQKIFRNYYESLIKNPNIQNRDTIIEQINQFLDGMTHPADAEVKLGEHTISLSQIGPKEQKIFIQFAKKFIKNTPLSEAQLEKLRLNFHHLNYLAPQIEEVIFVKQPLSAIEGEDFVSKAQNCLISALRKEQQEIQRIAAKKNSPARKRELAGRIIGTVAVTAAAVGIGVGLVAWAALIGPVFPVLLGFVAIVAVTGLYAACWSSFIAKPGADKIQESLRRVSNLDSYKKTLQKPDFKDFVDRNRLEQLQPTEDAIFKLIEIYRSEKRFQEQLEAAKDYANKAALVDRPSLIARDGYRIRDPQDLAKMTYIEKQRTVLLQQYNALNQSRANQKLEPLPKPEFLDNIVLPQDLLNINLPLNPPRPPPL